MSRKMQLTTIYPRDIIVFKALAACGHASYGQVQDLYEQRIVKLRDQGEEELAQSLQDLLIQGEVSPPDAVYTTEAGEQVVLEIVTNNYGEAELEEKTAFAEAVGFEADSIDFVRV